MRSLIIGAVLVSAAHAASAQDPLSNAKRVAHKAANAENAHIAAEQNVASATTRTGQQSPAAARGARQSQRDLALEIASRDTATVPPVIMREAYDYESNGRRDPFLSLLETNELRPALSDLKLTGILYDRMGGHSVATLRDLGTNALYRVSTGSTLGRMRVAAIRVKAVVFSIDEFGTTRQDSLVLGDSTKARQR